MSFKTILVPVERPKTARPALRHALGLAREMDAHVDVFHPQVDPALVLPPVFDGLSGVAFAPELISQAQQAGEELKADIRAMIEECLAETGMADVARERKAGLSVTFSTMIGAPA